VIAFWHYIAFLVSLHGTYFVNLTWNSCNSMGQCANTHAAGYGGSALQAWLFLVSQLHAGWSTVWTNLPT
jgi:hypothetical protein